MPACLHLAAHPRPKARPAVPGSGVPDSRVPAIQMSLLPNNINPGLDPVMSQLPQNINHGLDPVRRRATATLLIPTQMPVAGGRKSG